MAQEKETRIPLKKETSLALTLNSEIDDSSLSKEAVMHVIDDYFRSEFPAWDEKAKLVIDSILQDRNSFLPRNPHLKWHEALGVFIDYAIENALISYLGKEAYYGLDKSVKSANSASQGDDKLGKGEAR